MKARARGARPGDTAPLPILYLTIRTRTKIKAEPTIADCAHVVVAGLDPEAAEALYGMHDMAVLLFIFR